MVLPDGSFIRLRPVFIEKSKQPSKFLAVVFSDSEESNSTKHFIRSISFGFI